MELLELSKNDKKALQDKEVVPYEILTHNGKIAKITDKHIMMVSAIYHCMQRAEIANLMNISNDTVDTKIKRLKAELSIEDRIELIKLFQDWGFVKSKHEM
jgi:DNA-binding NarL/FixJ family response regulator